MWMFLLMTMEDLKELCKHVGPFAIGVSLMTIATGLIFAFISSLLR